MRNIERLAQHSGWRTVLSIFHQQAEHAQAGILCKSIKGGHGFSYFHMSRIMDYCGLVKSHHL